MLFSIFSRASKETFSKISKYKIALKKHCKNENGNFCLKLLDACGSKVLL